MQIFVITIVWVIICANLFTYTFKNIVNNNTNNLIDKIEERIEAFTKEDSLIENNTIPLWIEEIINNDAEKAEEFLFSFSDKLNKKYQRNELSYDKFINGSELNFLIKSNELKKVKSFSENEELKYNEKDKRIFAYKLNNVYILEVDVLWKKIEGKEQWVIKKKFFVFDKNYNLLWNISSDSLSSINFLGENILAYIKNGGDSTLEYIDTTKEVVHTHRYNDIYTDITAIWDSFLYLEDKTLSNFDIHKQEEKSKAYLLNLHHPNEMKSIKRSENKHFYVGNNYFFSLANWNVEVYVNNKVMQLPFSHRFSEDGDKNYKVTTHTKEKDWYTLNYIVFSSELEDIFLTMGKTKPFIIFYDKKNNTFHLMDITD